MIRRGGGGGRTTRTTLMKAVPHSSLCGTARASEVMHVAHALDPSGRNVLSEDYQAVQRAASGRSVVVVEAGSPVAANVIRSYFPV